LGVGEGFGVGDCLGDDGAAGAGEALAEGDGFGGGDRGVVVAGFRVEGDTGFFEGDGEGFAGVGEGAAATLQSGRQSAKLKISGRNLMKNARWIGRSAGRCQRNAASPPNYDIEVAAATTASTSVTLADALRVAKNFRMSDHRCARITNSP
jgi:hypothetical protein